MISAEEIKALMAKKSHMVTLYGFENGNLVEGKSIPVYIPPQYNEALSALQTLLNQAAEALQSCERIVSETDSPDGDLVYSKIAKALAAIQPNLTKGE